jgi:PKD repeat protein
MKKTFSLILGFVFLIAFHSSSQQYCEPTYSGSGTASSFFTHILKISFGEINRTYSAPWSTASPIYYNYTYLTTPLVKGHSYPLVITVGNGGNTQTLSLWIDFNQNQVFESSERLYTQTDNANVGDHILRTNITIPANALLGQTRMRVGTIGGTNAPDPCTNNSVNSQHFQDYTVEINDPSIQTYVSASTYQTTTDEVTASSVDNQILRIEVNTNTDGTLSPLSLDTMYFSSLGTTNPAEIANAKLYYTGKSPEFLPSNQLATTITGIGTYFQFAAKQKLEPGKNYFWLTYSIAPDAIIGNVVDARCNSVYVTTKRFPSVIDPSGNRAVGYCISKGNKSNFVYVRRVTIGNINNGITYYSSTGYTNYTYQSTELYKGTNYHYISVESGNGVNTYYTRAWIDFNRDGVFDHPSEMILHDSIMVASAANPNYGPVFDSFLIPLNAPVGPTRMRVISHYNPVNPPYRTPGLPCENPLEVGEVEDYTIIIADSGQTVPDFKSNIACFGNPSIFSDLSYTFGVNYPVSEWIWYFGDGDTSHAQSPQHIYANPGVYTVKLMARTNKPGAVWASVEKSVKVNNPVANFSWNNTLYQTPITFMDETSGGLSTSWYWDFGDPISGFNNYSNYRTPSHTFDAIGSYDVTLIVTTDGGCKDTAVKTIYIDSVLKPVADFSASTYTPYFNQDVSFIDQSVYYPSTYTWSISPSYYHFKNGTKATDQDIVLSFDSVMTYDVKLVVENYKGKDSVIRQIMVKDYSVPVAEFSATPTSVKAGQLVSFLDLSANDPSQWKWAFGNGDSSDQQHPIHAYPNVGNYSVSLTASNPAGSNTTTKTSYINVTNEYELCNSDAPTTGLFSGYIFDSGGKNAGYRNNSDCGFLVKPECSGPITLTFYFLDYDVNDYLEVYDGEDATGKKLFAGSGFTGQVKPGPLTAKSGAMYIREITDGAVVTPAQGFGASWNAVPNIAPHAIINADTLGFVRGPVTFYNGTILGANNTYSWDYEGDGVYVPGVGPDNEDGYYRFDSVGTYTVKMKVENCAGSDSITHTIRIIHPTSAPVADFTSDKDTVAEGERVYFQDLSSNGPSSWKWIIKDPNYFATHYFAEGTSDTSQNPIIEFYGTGAFDVSLFATNKIGSSAQHTKKKYIVTVAIAQMGTWPFEVDAPAGRIFDGGGPNADYLNNENHYKVLRPCAKKVYLRFNTFNFASGDFVRVYDGEDNTGIPLHPGNGFTTGAQPNPNVPLVAKSGVMYIEEVTNSSGTAPGFSADWYIDPIPDPLADFIPPDTAYTNGAVTLFENTSSGVIDNFYWDYDFDGFADDSTNYNGEFAFSTPKTQFVQLIVSNCAGINISTKSFPVVDQTQKPEAHFEADVFVVDTSDIVTFSDQSHYGPTNWEWTFDPPYAHAVSSYGTTYPKAHIVFDSSGQYDVQLKVSNSFGTDSLIKNMYINVFAYCRPSVSNLLTDFGISRVWVGEIDKKSDYGIQGYTDYTKELSASFELGGAYHFTVSTPSSTTAYTSERKIWIDYNQDGVFTEPEELAAFLNSGQQNDWSDTIHIPTAASLGATRMRVSVNVDGYPHNPCGPNQFGEIEDYRIYITEDKTPPIIELIGSKTTFSEIGYPYVDEGAVAHDVVDGDVSADIVVTGSVDTSKASTTTPYLIRYNVKDEKGNEAEEVVREVWVTNDRTPPVVSLLGDNPMAIELNQAFFDPGATAMDARDGDVSSSIIVQHSIDITRVDSYNVAYTAYDSWGNTATKTRKLLVEDRIKPVITLLGPDTLAMPIGGTLNDPGAEVTDNYYTNLTYKAVNNVKPAKEGWYIIRYNAEDPSGNKADEVRRTVKVGNPVSVYEEYLYNYISIFPNPSKDVFNLSINLSSKEDAKIVVLNSVGKQIKYLELHNIESVILPLDLHHEAEGIYFVKTYFRNKVVTNKIILVR